MHKIPLKHEDRFLAKFQLGFSDLTFFADGVYCHFLIGGNVSELEGNFAEHPFVSFLIPVKAATTRVDQTITTVMDFLQTNYANHFELIVIINGPKAEEEASNLRKQAVEHYSESQLKVLAIATAGKGAALKAGFFASKGSWIFTTDADLPYGLEFFTEAGEKLFSGFDLVTGNRRLAESTFTVPSRLLHLVYKRHRMGLAFNWLVARSLFGIKSSDTQAGIKAMIRNFAELVFSRQNCPGFLFDLEYFLVLHANDFQQAEIPIHFKLHDEKSTVQILRQTLEILNWVPRLAIQKLRGSYGPKTSRTFARMTLWGRILKNIRPNNLSTSFFLCLRWMLTPYEKISQFLPEKGRVLDLACGHGLLALLTSFESKNRQVDAFDHDENRLGVATKLADKIPNLRFARGSLLDSFEGPYDAVTIIDSLHYLSFEEQQNCLKEVFRVLTPNGLLLFREVESNAGARGWFNRIWEVFAVKLGFTASSRKDLSMRSTQDWRDLAQSLGFQVVNQRCSFWFFSDVLFICRKGETLPERSLPWRLTADDWGLSPGVNEGILALAQKGIIRCVSVLADGRYATYKLDELKSLPSVEIGLHFALSFSDQETSSDAFRSGRNFLRYYFSPKISRQEKITQFQNEWHRQLEMLSSLGIKPAYVDGHHHIHAFPLVAKALVAASKPLRVRIPYDPSLWLSKKAPINLLSLLSSRIFRMAGWSSAPFVYPNFETVKNPFKLGSLLKTMPDSSEIIFHPSAKDDLEDIGSQDTYRSQRCVEYHGLTQLPTVLGYLKI